ncbi:MAG TPA: hypothetical protein VKY59_00445 [Spirillospora sp.]|nr:hypothetical protein [Spirillospora sp.]
MSSLPAEPGFTPLLETSFAVMSSECPEAYQRICQLLAGDEVGITIDAESLSVRFEAGQAVVLRTPQQPTVHVAATKQTLLDLIDARYTLEHAITRDLLHVRGKMNELIRFYEAVQLYIHGAVRCPSFPDLLSDYRYRN